MTTGNYNTAVGSAAGDAVLGADNNTLIGWHAGTAITSGPRNTFVGYQAGSNHTTGDGRNICIGDDAILSAATNNRELVIGHNQTGAGTETAMIRGTNGVYNSANNSAWSTTSDRRIKKNIVDNAVGLDVINQIRVRNFEYRLEEEIVDFENPRAAVVEKEGLQIGAIAQEIVEVLPETVLTQSTGVMTVNPDRITWHLVNAVKELSAKNEALEARLAALESK